MKARYFAALSSLLLVSVFLWRSSLELDSKLPPALTSRPNVTQSRETPFLRGDNPTKVLLTVISQYDHFHLRAGIRNTWGNFTRYNTELLKEDLDVEILFVIADKLCDTPSDYVKNWRFCSPDAEKINSNVEDFQNKESSLTNYSNNMAKLLQQEQNQYNDILALPMVEVYGNLPLKMHLLLKSLTSNKSSPDYLIKVDDDTFVRMDNLIGYVSSQDFIKRFPPQDPVVIGKIARGWKVHRDGKWAEKDYQPRKYPAFPQGSAGYLLSRRSAELIAKHNGFFYQGEDTSLGIWSQEINSHLEDEQQIEFIDRHDLFTVFNWKPHCSGRDTIVFGHDLTPEDMEICLVTNLGLSYV